MILLPVTLFLITVTVFCALILFSCADTKFSKAYAVRDKTQHESFVRFQTIDFNKRR